MWESEKVIFRCGSEIRPPVYLLWIKISQRNQEIMNNNDGDEWNLLKIVIIDENRITKDQ